MYYIRKSLATALSPGMGTNRKHNGAVQKFCV